MLKSIGFTVILIGVMSAKPINAQRHPERMTVFNPLNKSLQADGKAVKWFPGFYGTGGFGKYTAIKDPDAPSHGSGF